MGKGLTGELSRTGTGLGILPAPSSNETYCRYYFCSLVDTNFEFSGLALVFWL